MSIRRRVGSLFCIASLWLVGPWLRPAAGQRLGPEFQVNTYTTSFQMDSAVAADDSGGFLVAWAGNLQDGSRYGIFGQRFDSAGLPAGGSFESTATRGIPSAIPWWPGTVRAASWSSGRVTSRAAPITVCSGGLAPPPACGTNSASTATRQVFQNEARVAAVGPGTFVVVWQSYLQDGSDFGVFGQRILNSGSPLGGEFRVNSYTTGSQSYPSVAADGWGKFVVVWSSALQDGSQLGVSRNDSTRRAARWEASSRSTVTRRVPSWGPR